MQKNNTEVNSDSNCSDNSVNNTNNKSNKEFHSCENLINQQINKLTDSNIDIISKNLLKIIKESDNIKQITNELFQIIIKNCLSQPIFIQNYIKLFSIIKNENICELIENNIDEIKFLLNIMYANAKIEEYDLVDANNLFIDFIKQYRNNKIFIYIGNIYAMYYQCKFITNQDIDNILKEHLKQIRDIFNWSIINNSIVEQYINFLIGVLKYLDKTYITNNEFIKENIEIIINEKKLNIKMKFNL